MKKIAVWKVPVASELRDRSGRSTPTVAVPVYMGPIFVGEDRERKTGFAVDIDDPPFKDSDVDIDALKNRTSAAVGASASVEWKPVLIVRIDDSRYRSNRNEQNGRDDLDDYNTMFIDISFDEFKRAVRGNVTYWKDDSGRVTTTEPDGKVLDDTPENRRAFVAMVWAVDEVYRFAKRAISDIANARAIARGPFSPDVCRTFDRIVTGKESPPVAKKSRR